MRRIEHRFDFALSFAGKQRDIAETIRSFLVKRGNKVFYDRDYEHEMIGKNGVEYLRNIYSHECQFCLVLISREYDQSQWTSLEKEAIEGRELRGDQGVLIPIRVDDYLPQWLPETRIYFDLSSRPIEDLINILCRIVANIQLCLSDVSTQDDLFRALPGTTWRKKSTGLEHIIFKEGGLFYNNHAGHPKWRENYYRIDQEYRNFTVTWTVDNFTTGCVFNETFSEFYEVEHPDDGVWTLLSIQPHTPRWGV